MLQRPLTKVLSRTRTLAPFIVARRTHNNSDEKTTHFGFQTIRESDKAREVHQVFENVAHNYDKMNDALSLGVHRLWKDTLMCRLAPTRNTRLVDVAGGTGDIAFRFLNWIRDDTEGCHVAVADINENMLEVGRRRGEKLGHSPELISWREADAEQLPFRDEEFNAYTIAFGIRNCTRIDRVLEEAYRVLAPGGRFLCLEFSHMENEIAQWLYDQYSFQVIPVLGHVIAGQWQAYQYLVESIRQFPKQENFKGMIEEAGFREVSYENLSLGMVAIHSGFKL